MSIDELHASLTPFKVNGSGNGMQTDLVTDSGHKVIVDEPPALGGQNVGPNPMEYLLAAFTGCVTVMVTIIAGELSLPTQGVRWGKVEAGLDLKGLMGEPGAIPHLQTLIAEIAVITPEAPDSPKFLALQEKVLARCPVLTMYAKSGLQIDLKWSAVAA
jgi:hypothetical protein